MIKPPSPIFVERLPGGRYLWHGILKTRARACLVGFYTYKTKAGAIRAGKRAYALLWPDTGDMI